MPTFTNKLVLIPLISLIVIALFVQFYALGGVSDSFTTTNGYGNGTNDLQGYNGTNGQLDLSGISTNTVTLVLSTGFIALFLGMAIIGILAGLDIEVLGSTIKLSERSQKLMYNGLLYGGLWGLFSVLATTGVNGNGEGLFSIQIGGIIIYAFMTLFYVLGVNQEINN